MSATLVELLKADGALPVGDGVAEEGVGQLGHEVEVRRVAVDGKSGVTGPAASCDAERFEGSGRQVGLAGGPDADKVGAQVGDDDEPARGVGDGLVRMGSLLPLGVGTGLLELEDLLGEEREGSGVSRVPSGKGRSAAR